MTDTPIVILADYPAYDIIEPPRNRDGLIVLKDGDELASSENSRFGNGRYLNHYKVGSVVSSALRNGDDPIKALDRARERGHNLHFIFALGSSITAWARPKGRYLGINIGDVVEFEGRVFEIVKQPNSNLGLKQISDDAYAYKVAKANDAGAPEQEIATFDAIAKAADEAG